MEQVCSFTGAGQHHFWRRWAAYLAQVGSILGAGGILRVGPAPQIVVLCIVLAQVPTLFPHLRQNAHTPAPTFSTTCANDRDQLMNGYHHLGRL